MSTGSVVLRGVLSFLGIMQRLCPLGCPSEKVISELADSVLDPANVNFTEYLNNQGNRIKLCGK